MRLHVRASGGYDRERTVVELGSAQVLEVGGEEPPAKAPAAVTGCFYLVTTKLWRARSRLDPSRCLQVNALCMLFEYSTEKHGRKMYPLI